MDWRCSTRRSDNCIRNYIIEIPDEVSLKDLNVNAKITIVLKEIVGKDCSLDSDGLGSSLVEDCCRRMASSGCYAVWLL
jgi:hypothetical protein